ncbi:MAG: Fic family protein [Clostridia bacterium]|nr:Fic family protein [Clostridia bacterium]
MESYSPPFRMTDEITGLVIEIGELVGAVSVDAGLSPDPMLRRENRIRTVYSSLAIEQNTLSLDQVTDVIDGKRVLGPPKDIREVKNAYEAYERMELFDPCSMDDLLAVHRLMMQDLVTEAGQFRAGNVGVFREGQLIHAGTPAAYVPEVMAQLFAWLRESGLHPLIKSCVFHYEFEFIHPFADGNGRTGRFWQSLILQRWKPIFAWLPVETLIRERQEEYYAVLNAANSQGESTAFVAFMLSVIRDALEELRQNQRLHVVNNDAENVVDQREQNRRSLLTIVKQRPKCSAREIALLMNLSPRQIQRIMADLQADGKLIRHGSPRNGFWEVAD